MPNGPTTTTLNVGTPPLTLITVEYQRVIGRKDKTKTKGKTEDKDTKIQKNKEKRETKKTTSRFRTNGPWAPLFVFYFFCFFREILDRIRCEPELENIRTSLPPPPSPFRARLRQSVPTSV